MELKQTIESAKNLLQQGDTGPALTLLIQYLQQTGKYPAMLRALRVVEANYNTTRQREIKGVISNDEAQRTYNQVTDAAYSALDSIEKGRSTFDNPFPMPKRWPYILASVLVGIALAAGGFYYFGKNARPECPDFGKSRPYILIVPFKNFGTTQDLSAAAVIKKRIDDLAEKNNFPLSIKVYNEYKIDRQDVDREEAVNIRQHCDANMVIWGFYKAGTGADSLKLDTRFIFGADNQTGGTGFRSFADLPEVATAQAYRSLDDVVFSMCSWVAFATHRDSLAVKWMDKVREKAPQDLEIMRRMGR